MERNVILLAQFWVHGGCSVKSCCYFNLFFIWLVWFFLKSLACAFYKKATEAGLPWLRNQLGTALPPNASPSIVRSLICKCNQRVNRNQWIDCFEHLYYFGPGWWFRINFSGIFPNTCSLGSDQIVFNYQVNLVTLEFAYSALYCQRCTLYIHQDRWWWGYFRHDARRSL